MEAEDKKAARDAKKKKEPVPEQRMLEWTKQTMEAAAALTYPVQNISQAPAPAPAPTAIPATPASSGRTSTSAPTVPTTGPSNSTADTDAPDQDNAGTVATSESDGIVPATTAPSNDKDPSTIPVVPGSGNVAPASSAAPASSMPPGNDAGPSTGPAPMVPPTSTAASGSRVAAVSTTSTAAPVSALPPVTPATTAAVPPPVPPTPSVPPSALAPLADPTGPHFKTTQRQNTIAGPVLRYIDDLAGRLADVQHDRMQRSIPPSQRTNLTNAQKNAQKPMMRNKFGLRTAFATPDGNAHVATNFVSMEFPERIFVYEVRMVRAYDNDGNQIMVKKPWDKLTIINLLAHPNNTFLGGVLHNNDIRRYWVTDGTLIWSTKPLFGLNPAAVPAPLLSTVARPIRYHNEMGSALSIAEVHFLHMGNIDLTRSVGELFYDNTAANFNNSVPGILTRGLNAFFTKEVRSTANITSIGQHKSFQHNNINTIILDRDANPRIETLRAFKGFFLSVRPGVETLYVNVNKAASPFFEHVTVHEFVTRCQAAPHRRSDGEIKKYLKGIKVRINYKTNNDQLTFPHPNSVFRFIKSVGDPVSLENRLSHANWPLANTVDHWYCATSPYATANEFPNPVLALSTNEWAINVGSDPAINQDNTEWYPASALVIVDFQQFRGRLTGDQTAIMIRSTIRPPAAHRADINTQGLTHFGFRRPGQGDLASASMNAGLQFIEIPCRWLNPPRIQYSTARQAVATVANENMSATSFQDKRVDNASWNLRDVGFANVGTTLTALPVLNLSGNQFPTLGQFRNIFRQQLRMHGLIANQNVPVTVVNANINHSRLSYPWEQQFARELRRVLSGLNLTSSIVLVILEKHSFDDYACVKRVADCQNHQTISNIALKYNIKTVSRGDNHHIVGNTLDPLKSRVDHRANTIVLGADVTHPNDGSTTATPSIAAVVGSIDDNFMKFPGSMRLQESKKEIISDLASMVKERVVEWARQHNDRLPANVLFYRDGVSESQYDLVRRREIPQIQTGMNLAFRDLHSQLNNGAQLPTLDPPGAPPAPRYPSLDIKMSKEKRAADNKSAEEDWAEMIENMDNNRQFNLTFVVVGKRHNTRFYPTNQGQQITGGNTNVKPGLVVDQVITHPYSMDFYLQSHQPIQGTGRSAHYIVLRNNMELSVSQIQSITNTFCFAYARATRGVSYCAPAYYADRLCDRGRAYLRRYLVGSSIAPALPVKLNTQTWQQYILGVRNTLRNMGEYRPHGAAPGAPLNPWHVNLNGCMFYL